jgi:hypothetical protein
VSDSQYGLPLLDFLEVTPTCPIKPILLSAANKYRRAVQLASELELPITANFTTHSNTASDSAEC